MKFRVTVDGRTFEVDVLDPCVRPVVAVVEGEQFEVWPEEAIDHRPRPTDERPAVNVLPPARVPVANGHHAEARPVVQAAAGAPSSSSAAVVAPIPGVIISVAVQAGQQVKAGQELCVLEAMKMQNAIRAPRDGVMASVRASAGQHVRHREVLMEYAA